MRFLAKLLGAVIPLSILFSASVAARDWSVIKESGTIIAATEGAFYPFNYFEGPKLTGYEVDVAEAVAKKLDLKLEWRVVSFDAQLASIRQDRFDFPGHHVPALARVGRRRQLPRQFVGQP